MPSAEKRMPVSKRVFLYLAIAIVVASLSFVLRTEIQLFPVLEPWVRLFSVILIVAIVLLARSLLAVVTSQLKTKEVQYVIARIGNLAIYAVGLFAFLSMMLDSWYPLALSLGLVGFALTFVLQAPLSSIMGWMYIMLKPLYAIGDVVEIGDERGIVRGHRVHGDQDRGDRRGDSDRAPYWQDSQRS
jgi:small-conductance mechanosensitive channel